MNFTNLTLAQLRAMTKAQLVTAIDNWLAKPETTKRRIIEMLLDVADGGEAPDDRQFTYHANGQWRSCLDVVRDALGVKLRSMGTVRTFIADGTVDTITTVEYDAKDTAIKRTTITYPHDGSQPVKSPVTPVGKIEG